jgi:glycosyltransferase involved in cell wall biosynthesis
MNIGFIEDTPLRGGTQIWVTEANRYFLKKGEKVTVLAPEGSWVANECKKDGANVFTYDYEEVVSKNELNKMAWAAGLEECDVAVCTVHPSRDSFHCSVFAAECIKEYAIDTVLIPKSGTIVPEYKREFYLPDETIRSTVIAITDFTREYLVNTYKIPADIVELIYQGTEVELFARDDTKKQEAMKRYPLPKNASPVLGYIGSFEERKGQTVLLDAVSHLANGSLPDVHLILVGEGPDEEMLKEKVKTLGLEKNVTFFPFTMEPFYVFEITDIVVLSSLYKEGLPNILLESMSMGVPVVSSRMAGVPEIVKNGQTGYMVKPGDSTELADAILKLWSDQNAYKSMSKNARQLMETQFDKKHQFEAFREYFHKVSKK